MVIDWYEQQSHNADEERNRRELEKYLREERERERRNWVDDEGKLRKRPVTERHKG